MPVIRVYYTGLPDANAWSTGAPGLNKSAVVLSFMSPPATVLSGADDAALAHFFDTAPTGHPIYYSYYAEPETYISDGHFSLAAFKAAWAHIVAIANAAHNPALKSTLILMAWDLSPQSGLNWKSYLPSGNVIDVLGWDAYPAGTVHDLNPQTTPPADFMGPEVAASKSVGLPFGFAEFALGRQSGRPAWLASVASYLQSSGALFGTLFNSAGFPWMQLNDSASIQAWRSAVTRSAENNPVSPPIVPTPTPTPPPTSPAGLKVSGLSVTPPTLAVSGTNHVSIKFTINQDANVTICVLNSQGTVLRTLAVPGRKAGQSSFSWHGFDRHGKLVPSGSYPILVVASNADGSASAETVATITSP